MATSNANPVGALLEQRLGDRKVADIWRQLAEDGVKADYTLVCRWFKAGHTGRCPSIEMVEPLARAMGLSEADRLELLRLASAGAAADDDDSASAAAS
jgi:7-cyano-7-deazaguanine synthase in queuosine biosynthesis